MTPTWYWSSYTTVPDDMQRRVGELAAILKDHGVACETAWSDDPGTVVYEDQYQVGVIPYVRGTPDPPPHGVMLGPTSARSKRRVAASPIWHVMFDADGVLQHAPGGWKAGAEPYLGERTMEFLSRAYDDELPALAGQREFLPLLAAAMADFGVTAPLEEVHRAIWLQIEPVEHTLALVRALRRNGYGVHLGTNQERNRAAHMREALGYDALFDVSCYSWELGVCKPDGAFFAEAARRIGAEPAAILFIDDKASNVAAARDVGLAAEQWSLQDGHDTLRKAASPACACTPCLSGRLAARARLIRGCRRRATSVRERPSPEVGSRTPFRQPVTARQGMGRQ
jgi:HAD superfamily hydrolase (TIGR01509 family)